MTEKGRKIYTKKMQGQLNNYAGREHGTRILFTAFLSIFKSSKDLVIRGSVIIDSHVK